MAGHLKLSNLCWIYDNNRITIEGNTALAFSEDVADRFFGYNWNVTRVGDANDLERLERAYQTALETIDRPTLIIIDSHIAYGSPHKHDTAAAHGEPLGADEVRATKRSYGWPEDARFLVPEGVRGHFRETFGRRGQELRRPLDGAVQGIPASIPGIGGPTLPHAAPPTADRLGQEHTGVRRRRQGDGHPRLLGRRAQRARAERALAYRRLGRSGAVHEDPPHVSGRRRFQCGGLRRAQPAFRHPRTHDGGRPQRNVPEQGSSLRLDLLDL